MTEPGAAVQQCELATRRVHTTASAIGPGDCDAVGGVLVERVLRGRIVSHVDVMAPCP